MCGHSILFLHIEREKKYKYNNCFDMIKREIKKIRNVI